MLLIEKSPCKYDELVLCYEYYALNTIKFLQNWEKDASIEQLNAMLMACLQKQSETEAILLLHPVR